MLQFGMYHEIFYQPRYKNIYLFNQYFLKTYRTSDTIMTMDTKVEIMAQKTQNSEINTMKTDITQR